MLYVILASISSLGLIIFLAQSHSNFTDVLSQKPSPNGLIVAAYVVEARGPMAGITYGLTIVSKSQDPLNGIPVLLESDDDQPIQYEWVNDKVLKVRLPCSLYSHKLDSVKSPGADDAVDIIYVPERTDCLIYSDGYVLKQHK